MQLFQSFRSQAIAVILTGASLAISAAASAQVDTAVVFSHPVLTEGHITAGFGQRISPFTKQPAWHNGIDAYSGWGAPIYSPANGVVVFAGAKAGYGRMVDVELEDGRRLRFGQLKSVAVTLGDTITAGTEVGLMGSSGRSTGPHLHFEVIIDGKSYDPENIEGLEIIATEN